MLNISSEGDCQLVETAGAKVNFQGLQKLSKRYSPTQRLLCTSFVLDIFNRFVSDEFIRACSVVTWISIFWFEFQLVLGATEWIYCC
jgi:hypothetical protein